MLSRMLPCDLTDQELLQRGQKVAELVAKKEALEAEKKDTASEFKAKIDRLESDIASIAKEVRSKKEYREVEVSTTKDYKRKVAETVRQDTGELVEQRTLTPAELQLELVQGKADKDKDKKGEEKKGAKKAAGKGGK